jgi:hypothetical protein
VVYLPIIYFFFPETKGRTLEEIGSLFGDENVVVHWYGLSEEEKEKIHQDALHLTETGRIVNEHLEVADAPPVKADDSGNLEKLS